MQFSANPIAWHCSKWITSEIISRSLVDWVGTTVIQTVIIKNHLFFDLLSFLGIDSNRNHFDYLISYRIYIEQNMLATPKKIHHSHVRQQESIMNSKAVLVFASIFNASHWRYLYEQATIVSMDFRLFVAKLKIVYIQFHSFTVNKP